MARDQKSIIKKVYLKKALTSVPKGALKEAVDLINQTEMNVSGAFAVLKGAVQRTFAEITQSYNDQPNKKEIQQLLINYSEIHVISSFRSHDVVKSKDIRPVIINKEIDE